MVVRGGLSRGTERFHGNRKSSGFHVGVGVLYKCVGQNE